MVKQKQFKYIDLFAGAGGLSEGFQREGFLPVAHVEMNEKACDTLKTRAVYYHLKEINSLHKYESYLKQEITRDELWSYCPPHLIDSVINVKISDESLKEIFERIDKLTENQSIDLIVGGPPCQAYSVIGRSRSKDSMANDPRNYLYLHYVEFLKKYKPQIFVFENVPGIYTAKNGEHFANIKTAINDAGYTVEEKTLNAAQYGVLQNRKRVILIGWKKEFSYSYPDIPEQENNYEVLSDLFSDLPHLEPGGGSQCCTYAGVATNYLKINKIRTESNILTQHITRPHNDRDLAIYKRAIELWLYEDKRLNYATLPEELKSHKNQVSFLDRYRVVNHKGCAHTVVAHISKDGHYYIYPDIGQIRSLSMREAARIQSFPDDYYFEGHRGNAFTQIGNAVPPLMAQQIAKAIKKMLKIHPSSIC